MRTTLMAGAFLLAAAMPAFAQGQTGPQNGPWQGRQMMMGNERGAMPMDEHMGKMMREHMGMMAGRLVSELAKGTFYRVRTGNDEVDVHCPQGVPLPECIQGAGQLIQDMHPTTGTAGSSSNSSGGSSNK